MLSLDGMVRGSRVRTTTTDTALPCRRPSPGLLLSLTFESSSTLALLRAIAEKLIPGIPEETRVSILQQTNAGDANTDDDPSRATPTQSRTGLQGPTVLEEVIDKATAKSELDREINGKDLPESMALWAR